MTVSGKHIEATAGDELLGVHSLDHFAFSVPDLTPAAEFHKAFGLNVVEDANALLLKTAQSPHTWCRIVEGKKSSRKTLAYLSFGIFERDMGRFKRRLETSGVKLLDPPAGFVSNGIWFRDPDNTLIELKVAQKTSPDQKSHGVLLSSDEGVAGATPRSARENIQPTRMSHILLFSTDVQKSIDFYSQMLGMGLSDRNGEAIAFMHGRHGSDHHMVAFVRSEGPGLHHTSWDVPSIHQLGSGAMQMVDRGFAEGWGLGRHVLGSNYFHYVRDPWGSYVEYSCDIDYIPAESRWQAGDHKDEDAFYIWGPEPPKDFSVNHQLVS